MEEISAPVSRLPGTAANPADGFAWLTVKLRVADVALKLALPPWLAVIEHVPAFSSITRSPEFLQTVGVAEAKVTGSPELASAAIGNGETPRI
jgi:hypothetical protein